MCCGRISEPRRLPRIPRSRLWSAPIRITRRAMQLTCGWAPTWAVHASALRTHLHTSSAALWAPHATGLLAALRGRLDRRRGRAARPLRRRRRRSWRRLLHRQTRLLQLRRWCRRCPRPPPNKEDCAQTPRLLVELVMRRDSRAAPQSSLRRLSFAKVAALAAIRLGLARHGLLVPDRPRDGAVLVDAEGVEFLLARDHGGLPDASAGRATKVWAPRRSRAWRRRRRTIILRCRHNNRYQTC